MSRSCAVSVLACTTAAILLATVCAQAADFYVSPTGTDSGNGSIGNPWDLQTALNQPASVQAGDTIWLRGGDYVGLFDCYLDGTSGNPIKVRQYPGERAIIKGGSTYSQHAALDIFATYTWFMNLEVTSSGTMRVSAQNGSWPTDINLSAGIGTDNNTSTDEPGCKLINCVVHDCAGNIAPWVHATNFEINGCLVYHAGWDAPDRGHGHGCYTQNNTGTKTLKDNVFFGGFSYGTQAYGSDAAYVDNFVFDGNTYFDSGILSSHQDNSGRNMLLGGSRPVQSMTCTNNHVYRRTHDSDCVSLGYAGNSSANGTATVTGNYFVGDMRFLHWTNLTVRNNTVVKNLMLTNPLDLTYVSATPSYDWDYNTYYCRELSDQYGEWQPFYVAKDDTPTFHDLLSWPTWRTRFGYDANSTYNGGVLPSTNVIFVRPNDYETGRGLITVYNWQTLTSVSVNVSSCGLVNGDAYEVRDRQNFFGTAVATGTYSGASISIPMNTTTAAQPQGNAPNAYTHTPTEFGCFILIKTGSGSAPAAPTGVAASDGTYADRVRVTWTASSGATSYEIFRDTTNDSSTASQIGTPSATSFDDTSAVPGTTYYYWAKATNAAGDSGFSAADTGYRSNATPFVLYLEGEAGILASPMTTASDPTASGGYYIDTTTVNTGTAQYTIDAPTAGDYVVWGRVYCPDGNSDSYFVSVDGGAEDVYDMAENVWAPVWQWTVVNGRGDGGAGSISPRVFTLTAGQHTFTFRGREVGAKLDRLCFTNDLTYVPFDSTANNPPAAVDDSAATRMGLDVLIPVLDNDSDPDLDALTVESVTTPSHGDATINVDNTITYTPDASYLGDDGFDYTISDGHGETDTATVTVTISELMWTLTVTSSPIIDVAMSGPPHCGGMTNYVVQCEPGAPASFTAPSIVVQPDKTYYFVRWDVGGVAQAAGQATTGFDVNADTSAAAVYKSVSQIRISGRSALFERTRGYYRATALFTDGSSKVVTNLATWKTSSTRLRLVGAGVFDAQSVSKSITRKITARCGGVTGTFNVTIRNR